MQPLRPAITSFTAGELSPKMLGRIDFQKYQYGCKTMENFFPWPQGMASFRPGTHFIAETKTSAKKSRLIPFEFSRDQAYMLEFGDQYVRVYRDQMRQVDNLIDYYDFSNRNAGVSMGATLTRVGQSITGKGSGMVLAYFMLKRVGSATGTLTAKLYAHSGTFGSTSVPTGSALAVSDTINASSIGTADFAVQYFYFPTPYTLVNGTKYVLTLERSATDGEILVGVDSSAPWHSGNYCGYTGSWAADSAKDLVFITNLNSGTSYEIASPYLEEDLWKINYTQSADVLYLACDGYAPRKLSRTGHTSWTLAAITFEDGPYLAEEPDLNIGLKPSAKTGTGITLTAKNLGLEKVKNGYFDYSPDAYWTLGNYWVVANNRLNHNTNGTGTASQDIGVEVSKTYLLSLTIGGASIGSIDVRCGGVTVFNDEQGIGTFMAEFTATTTGALEIDANNTNYNGYIDNISVREVVSDAATFFNPNHVGAYFRLQHQGKWGYCKVTGYTSGSQVTADVITTEDGTTGFGNTCVTAWWREGAWSVHRGWPSLVTFFEDRLFWAATSSRPQTLWGSQSGDYENHAPDKHLEVTDASAIAVTINADEVNTIKWLLPGKNLLVGTARGQWVVSGANASEALSPSNVAARRSVNLTSSEVAIAADHTFMFWQAFGKRLMELSYTIENENYVATDLSVMADHIGNSPIKEMCYLQEPASIVLAVREDGQLVTLTYERQHQVVGWARHVTDGIIESVATMAGANRDEVWLIVKRTINGATKRYVELLEDLESYEAADSKDMFYVDCGLTYTGAPITVIDWLSHLEGKTVAIFADGRIQTSKTVSSGAITLETAASKVQLGLPYTGILIPVEMEVQVREGTAQGRVKRIAQLVARLYKSHQGKLGRNVSNLDTIPYDTEAGALTRFTGDKRLIFSGDFDRNVTLALVQDKPMPMNVLGFYPVLAME